MTRQQAIIQQHLTLIKQRAWQAFGLMALLYLALAGRLIYLQAVKHHYYQKQADLYRVSKSLLPAQRGLLLDRNGDPLAVNVPAAAVFADPHEITDPRETASKLAPLLGQDPQILQNLLTLHSRRSHFVSLLRHAPVELGNAVKRAGLKGVGVMPDTRRAYPKGGLAAQVLGFTAGDGKGAEGLERSQEALLHGTDGEMVGEIDLKGRFLPGTVRKRVDPQNGQDLVLTLDPILQHDADSALTQAVQAHHAQSGVAVVLDPRTGEILALSNAPSYDPNAPRPLGHLNAQAAAALQGQWRDRAVSDLYEPGSTLKTITAAAVLQEEGLGMMGRHVYCSGQMHIGKRVIHCAQDPPYYGVHGDETLRGVLKESCNIGMAQFGIGLGADPLYQYEQKFGFLDKPGSGLPGEQKSPLQSPAEFNRHTGRTGWSRIQLANISFGQGIGVTPLQLAAAYGAIANNGLLMQPHILRAIRQGDRETPVAPKLIRRVLDPDVAAMVRSMLGTVVQDGTGKPAQIANFSVGGKTGSAQVSGPHGYEAGHYVASFVGLVPLSHPRLVILCAVFEPQGVHWGASVAAPVVHDLAKAAMLEMHLTPDAPDAIDWDDHLKAKYEAKAKQIARL